MGRQDNHNPHSWLQFHQTYTDYPYLFYIPTANANKNKIN